MLNEVNARYSPKWGRARIKFPPPLKTLYWIQKVSSPYILTFPRSKELQQRNCFIRTSPLTIAYITIIFKKEPWEGGKGGLRFRVSPGLGVWTATWLDTTQVFTQTRFWPTLCKIKLVSISCRDKKLKFLLFIKVPTPFSPFGVVQSQKTKGNILRTLDNGWKYGR